MTNSCRPHAPSRLAAVRRPQARLLPVGCALALLLACSWPTGEAADAAPPVGQEQIDAVGGFAAWLERFVAAPELLRPSLGREGLHWASLRREQIALLIRTDPARALAAAVSPLERELLPPAILAQLERPVSGFGDFLLQASEPAGPDGAAELRRTVRLGSNRYQAFVYGRRLAQGTKRGIPLAGVALDGALALRASVLGPRDGLGAPLAGEPFIDLAGDAPSSSAYAWAEMGGRLYRFADATARAETERRLVAAESGPEAEPAELASVAIDPFTARTAATEPIGRRVDLWTQGTKKVLVLLVDFADLPGAPADAATVQSLFDRTVAPFYARASYGRLSLVAAVAPRTYRLPRTAATYATGGLANELLDDACAAAAAEFDPKAFDRVVVGFKRLAAPTVPGSQMSFAGLSDVHGRGVWVNGTEYFNAFLLIHELGHTMGLLHANLWQVTDGSSTSAAGSAVNQGDLFDPMGQSGYLTEAQDFNPFFKYRMGWLDECHVRTVVESGTHRVAAFDYSAAGAKTEPLALRIPCGDQRAYWVSCRRNYPAEAAIQHAAYLVRAEELYNPGTSLIDTNTPGTDPKDAGVAINQTVTDSAAGITIKPIAESGTAPNSSMEIAITLAPKAPTIITQPAARSIDPGSAVEFAVAASGTPPPSFQWAKEGVAIPGATGATLRLLNVDAADAGAYSVLVANAAGSVRSQDATLTVAAQKPVIVRQPPNRLAPVGGAATFAVTATSTLPLTYQWFTDGHAIAGATGSELTLTNLQASAAGYYSVLVANSAGTAWSGLGLLTVGTASVEPVITKEPQDLVLPEGGSGQFTISAMGADALHYIWHKDTQVLANTNGPYQFHAVTAADSGKYYCYVADNDSGTTSQEVTLTVVVPPKIVRQTDAQAAAPGSSVRLSITTEDTTAAATCRWLKNGTAIAGATSSTLDLAAVSSAAAGLYQAEVADGIRRTLGAPIVVGLRPAGRTAGAVTTRPEWQNIRHPNGNIYDQFLLDGAAGTITADPGQIARVSLLDPEGDIVQVEMSGAGALTVVLENPSGPKTPTLYNQPGVHYMQGHPTIILVGADANTHMSIFSVGRLTNPGVTRADVAYDGWADIRALGLDSTDRGLGGLYLGNARFSGDAGPIGLHAPTVATIGRVAVHAISATSAGQPQLVFATDGTAEVRIAGSSLQQPNGAAIAVAGIVGVTMAAGQGSSGQSAPAAAIAGHLVQNGVDITDFLVTGP